MKLFTVDHCVEKMQIILTTIGKNHSFELARQLYQHEVLAGIYTGYPRYKLQNEALPQGLIHTFPWLQTFYMAKSKFGLNSLKLERELAWWSNNSLDRYVSAHIKPCDIFMALSNTGLQTGKKVRAQGGIYICDRGCSHIRYQDTLLREEYALQGVSFPGVDPRIVAREEAEYEEADVITVPSQFSKKSFLAMGVPARKLVVVPYGVEVSRFHPVGEPDPEKFNVIFVGAASFRKGIPYLLEAFARLKHPGKHLHLVGTSTVEMKTLIQRYVAQHPVTLHGHCPQQELKTLLSKSHVMVLPSIEDGFGLVMAEAMACGCPVIATTNTGSYDLYKDDYEGYIVPIRDATAITDKMEMLAQCPELRASISAQALQRVQSMGGWKTYGDAMYYLFGDLLKAHSR